MPLPLGLAGGGNNEFNRGPNAGGAGFFEGGNTAMSMEVAITSGRIDEDGFGKKKEDMVLIFAVKSTATLWFPKTTPW